MVILHIMWPCAQHYFSPQKTCIPSLHTTIFQPRLAFCASHSNHPGYKPDWKYSIWYFLIDVILMLKSEENIWLQNHTIKICASVFLSRLNLFRRDIFVTMTCACVCVCHFACERDIYRTVTAVVVKCGL